jgi:hypothetical protein
VRFVYEYRTSDNVRHDGEIAATDREAAFRALKEIGIRPGRLETAPGFFNKYLGNWKLRLAAIGFFAVTAVGVSLPFVSSYFVGTREEQAVPPAPVTETSLYVDENGFAKPIERRQIWGDEAVITAAARQNWRVIFSNPAERLLALFAEPGMRLSMLPRLPDSLQEDMEKALRTRLTISPDELDEYRQMKCIVEGMKAELRDYVAAGGNLTGYIRRLQARQNEEVAFLEKARVELEKQIESGADPVTAWQEMNKRIREQGLPALPMPGIN